MSEVRNVPAVCITPRNCLLFEVCHAAAMKNVDLRPMIEERNAAPVSHLFSERAKHVEEGSLGWSEALRV